MMGTHYTKMLKRMSDLRVHLDFKHLVFKHTCWVNKYQMAVYQQIHLGQQILNNSFTSLCWCNSVTCMMSLYYKPAMIFILWNSHFLDVKKSWHNVKFAFTTAFHVLVWTYFLLLFLYCNSKVGDMLNWHLTMVANSGKIIKLPILDGYCITFRQSY